MQIVYEGFILLWLLLMTVVKNKICIQIVEHFLLNRNH